MRSFVRSRFSPTLGISWILVVFLLFAVTASEDGTKASTSATTVESSSTDPTTELMSSASTSEESTSASTTDLSIVATTTETNLPECSPMTSINVQNLSMACSDAKMKMEKNGQDEFQTADFSDFTQEEFEMMLQVKNVDGTPNAFEKRKFIGNFLADGSKITNIDSIIFTTDPILQSFTLRNNPNLEDVKLKSTGDKKFLELVISGNKKLSHESLNHLKGLGFKTDSSYIQDFGECDFNSIALSKASQLSGCHYIRKDLVINASTNIDVTNAEDLKNVTGCIKIIGAEITNLNLLDNIKVTTCSGPNAIKDNNKLCLHPGEINALKTYFEEMKDADGNSLGQTVEYENNMACKGECNSTYLKNSKDKTCIIITDNLEIKGIKEEDDTTYLNQIEELRGSLYIKETDLTNVTLLPNLTTIVFDKTTSGRAIFIQENKKMVYFDLPKLTTVILHKNRDPHSAAFVMENNGNYTMQEEQAERLSNVTQTDIEKLPVYYDPGNYTVNMTMPRRARKKNETNVEDSDEPKVSDDKNGKIAGGVVGVIVVFLIISGAFLLFFFIRYMVKKRKQNKMTVDVQKIVITVKDITTESKDVIAAENADKCDTSREMYSVKDDDDDDVPQEHHMAMKERVPGAPTSQGLYKYFKSIEQQFQKLKRYNYDVTQILGAQGVHKIKIKRDLDFEAASKVEPETMKEQKKKKKIYTHNPLFTLYGIRPRKEKTEELVYNHGDGEFNPESFINTCMDTCALQIKYETMIAALDYVMKNKRFGNPHDPNEPPKQLIEVTGPVHIVGDTHGSLMDVQMIFSLDPENVAEKKKIHPMLYYKYLFTGDYLDRGIYDTTVFAFLTVFATLYPTRVFLLRGNHEWIDELDDFSCTAHCRRFWSNSVEAYTVRDKIIEISCFLPLAARINGRALAVHGGIGHFWENDGLQDNLEERFDTIPMPLCMAELHFGNYLKQSCFDGWKVSKIQKVLLAAENLMWNDPDHLSCAASSRGCGAYFNDNDIDNFIERFDLDLIIRAHQDIGFYYAFGGKLISLFGSFDSFGSKYGVPYLFADNHRDNFDFKKHCDKLGNTASTAVLRINSDNRLHFLLMRHLYEGDDCIAGQPLGEGYRFTANHPDLEWKAKKDQVAEDQQKNSAVLKEEKELFHKILVEADKKYKNLRDDPWPVARKKMAEIRAQKLENVAKYEPKEEKKYKAQYPYTRDGKKNKNKKKSSSK